MLGNSGIFAPQTNHNHCGFDVQVDYDGETVRTLKLADFGLAQKVTGPLFAVCGTPTYVAPEVLAEMGYGLEVRKFTPVFAASELETLY